MNQSIFALLCEQWNGSGKLKGYERSIVCDSFTPPIAYNKDNYQKIGHRSAGVTRMSNAEIKTKAGKHTITGLAHLFKCSVLKMEILELAKLSNSSGEFEEMTTYTLDDAVISGIEFNFVFSINNLNNGVPNNLMSTFSFTTTQFTEKAKYYNQNQQLEGTYSTTRSTKTGISK